MAWRVEISRTAQKQITRLDHPAQAVIVRYLRDRVQPLEDPRQLGKPSRGEKKGLWRYRVGDYRITCDLRDETATVMVLTLGHRKEVSR